MNNAEMAAAAWAKDYDGAKARLWLRPSHITAFLAGAAWQREGDLAILRSSKADQFLATYSMGIAADYLEAATKQDCAHIGGKSTNGNVCVKCNEFINQDDAADCQCECSDAWRCAVRQKRTDVIACRCECHGVKYKHEVRDAD